MNVAEFLNEFQLEAEEKLDLIAGQLLRLERDATNPQPVREMFLAAHTIKGGAAMMRLTDVEALAHAIEDLLSSLRDQLRTLDGPTADLLFKSLDQLRGLIAGASAESVGAEPNAWVINLASQLRMNACGRSETVGPTPGESRRRALLVDNSPTVRELHRMLLEDCDYEVEECDDGQAALTRALAEPFDLVVSGVQNIGLGGFELMSALRAHPRCREATLVLASADENPELARRAAECGAQALVRKSSLHDDRLTDVVRHLAAKPG
jgi:chemotaxis protein histidine kinase CheA